MTTDYASDSGCPEPYLQRISDAGYTHVHWCHHWCTDFLYSRSEIEQLRRWLDVFGLQVLDLHGSAGQEKGWCSAREHERLAGVELVDNRVEMAARLGAGVVVMHLPAEMEGETEAAYWWRTFRTLDALQPWAAIHDVRIALENLSSSESFDAIATAFERYPVEFLGLCYDSGHGNQILDGLGRLDEMRGRLISVHLHDNDGTADQHRIPFNGTVDWERLGRIMARSAYDGPVSMEVSMRNEPTDGEAQFLMRAREAGEKVAALVR